MKHAYRLFSTFILATVITLTGLTAQAADNPSPSGDPFIGAFEGVYTAAGRDDYVAKGQIINVGRGLYKAKVGFGTNDGAQQYGYVEIHGSAQGSKLMLSGYSNDVHWTGTIQDGKLRIGQQDAHYSGAFRMDKVIHHSPTEGLTPPRGSDVILPYAQGAKTNLDAMTNDKWEILDDGVMRVKGKSGDQKTKKSYGDVTIHLEFKLAHMPNEHGQARSNSGLYVQDRYETQILDSFGLMSGSGDCGGIYEQAIPLVNACYPPGQWQTYDVQFKAARFNKDGSVKSYPTMTVELNGVTVQRNHVFRKVTGGAVNDDVPEKGRIRLQDHGDPVEYRNFWVVDKS